MVRYAERGGGERNVEVERESPAGDRARGIVCEKGPVFKMRAASVLHVKARQRARGRKERRWSKSDGKGEAKGSSEGFRIKKEKRKHTERERICPYIAKGPKRTYVRERGMMDEVSRTTCMTRG